MNWTTWVKSIAAVAIGGAATGAASALGNGQLNRNAAVTAGIGALATVLAYLMRSPLGPATPQDALPPVSSAPLSQRNAVGAVGGGVGGVVSQ
jgi:hypothetical protein